VNQVIVKTFVAGGAIGHRRLVKLGAADGVVLQGAAATDAVIGVADCPGGAVQGQRIDIVLLGFADVEFGGAVTRGNFLVSDASGRAVAAAPAAGANVAIAGRSYVSAILGDVMPALINPGQIQG